MELFRYDAEKALPLEGGSNANYIPVMVKDRLAAMLLHLGRKGDTGKREVPNDVILSVISGEGRCRSGGAIADLSAGDVLVLTGGILHHIWTSDSELTVVMMAVTR